MLIHQEVRELLGEFRLEGMQTHLDRTLEAAGQEKSDPLVVVRNLLRQEKSSRQERKKRLLLRCPGYPTGRRWLTLTSPFSPVSRSGRFGNCTPCIFWPREKTSCC